MKTYSRMPDETAERVAHLLKCFHPEIVKAGVTIDLLSVATDGDTPPLKLHGVTCAAVVRGTNVKERTKGAADVEITFDEERYLAMSDPERDALIDHELEHIALKRDKKTGMVKLDCRGRPKVGMKHHDADFGWFRVIAERHGMASLECKQAANLFIAEKQTFFAFVGTAAQLTEGGAS